MGLFTQITYSHLPRAKKKKRKGKIHRQNKTNLNHRSIEIRCKAIMHRSDFGHWNWIPLSANQKDTDRVSLY